MFGITVFTTCLTITVMISLNCLARVFPPGPREAPRVSHEAVQSCVWIGRCRHLGLLCLSLSNLGLLGSHQL